MPRKSPRKALQRVPEVETTKVVKTSVSTTSKKKSIKVECTEVIEKSPVAAESKSKTVAKSRAEVKGVGDEEVPPKINRVKAKAVKEEEAQPKAKKQTKKRKSKADDEENEEIGEKEGADGSKPKKKRKTKEEKEAEAMPLAPRTVVGSLKKAMRIGAHVSGAGGVHNAIDNALHIGGNSFALFLKSQRKWTSPPLAPEVRDQFKEFCLKHDYDATRYILPHGSYLVNLAQLEADKADQAYSCFLDDLHRCEALGIKLYNFHPGNTGKEPRPEAIARIAAQLNKAHRATSQVVTVLENMAGQGNVIGSTWEDLRDIIALIDDKSRVGVCIDTCHTFAAGYDLRSPEAFEKTMTDFSDIVGMPFLKALHLNDSKAPLSSNRDLHANIGTGFLGLRAFHNVMNFEAFQGLPMVLETPIDTKGDDGKMIEDKRVWATEIKLLEGLIGADPDSEDFKKEEQRLQDAGVSERIKLQGQVDKRKQKTLDAMLKKASPKKKKQSRKKDDGDGSDDSEGGCSH